MHHRLILFLCSFFVAGLLVASLGIGLLQDGMEHLNSLANEALNRPEEVSSAWHDLTIALPGISKIEQVLFMPLTLITMGGLTMKTVITGMAILPVALAIGLVCALSLLSRPWMVHLHFPVLVLSMALFSPVINQFKPFGSLDAGLAMVLLTAMLGGVVSLFARQKRPAFAFASGLFAALSIWHDPATLIIIVGTFFVLCLFWVWKGGIYLQALVRILQGATVGLMVIVAFEWWGDGLLTVRYSKVSFVHLALMACGAAYWTAFEKMASFKKSPGPSVRCLVGLSGIFIFLTMTFVVFPGLLPSLTLFGVDVETRTALQQAAPGFQSASVATLAVFAPLVLVAGGYCLVKVQHETDPMKDAWISMSLLMGLLVLMGMWQQRWLLPLAVFALMPWSLAVIALWQKLKNQVWLVRGAACLLMMLVPQFIGLAF